MPPAELKHGPIALIDENMPVVVIAPFDRVFEKTVSNMQEVAARGGEIILMTDAKGAKEATIQSLLTIVLPDMAATFHAHGVCDTVQLLAYITPPSSWAPTSTSSQSREIRHRRIGPNKRLLRRFRSSKIC